MVSPTIGLDHAVHYFSSALTLDWMPENPLEENPFLEARIPGALLPVLLHELTHSQCFTTVVGETLADLWRLIFAASRNPSIAAQIEERHIPDDFLRLYQNLAAGIALYEPFTEGLALFAQWDALPGDAAAASKSLLTACELFLSGSGMASEQAMWSTLISAVIEARVSETGLSKKRSLLSVAVDGPNGHYLAGYLSIKNLFSKAVQRSRLLRDSDFFCSFACSVIFQDPVAAGLLLDVDTPLDQWLSTLRARLESRLALFERDDLDALAHSYQDALVEMSKILPCMVARHDNESVPEDFATQYEQHVALETELANVRAISNKAMGVEPEDWDRISYSHLELQARFVSPDDPRYKPGYLLLLKSTLRHRSMVRLRKHHGTAIVEGGDIFLADASGRRIAKIEKLPQIGDAEKYEDSTYVLYHDPHSHYLLKCIYVMLEAGPLFLGASCFSIAEEPDLFRANELFRAIMLNERTEAQRHMAGAENDVLKVVNASLPRLEHEVVRKTALNVALGPILDALPTENSQKLTGMLSPIGIWGWLGRNGLVVDTACSIGINAADMPSEHALRARLPGPDFDYDMLVEHLRKFEEDYKLTLLTKLTDEGKTRVVSHF